ncbi:MAG: hypothetical protein C4K58_00025 [Flavobacteriaceae bacterium]|nr:MAG: hypothetical protein C4K58_00025 [Flavobacteriaceae bacterium]
MKKENGHQPIMKKLLTLFTFILGFTLGFSQQQYPVKLVPVMLPPYNLRLADYSTGSENKFQLQMMMTDLLEPQHQVGIKFSLEGGLGGNTIARSTDFISGQNPITLLPGSNITLTNLDLRSLFALENLQGITPSQYAQPLPDGVYNFCFQVFDYTTKRNLSDKSCATVYLTQYDPPFLTLPQIGEKIQSTANNTGPGIVFQWMPRQTAPNTKYTFVLKELWDQGQSPISGFLSSPVLWKEETLSPNLYYGLDKTQLIPGKRYAWQVQAKSGNPVYGDNPTSDNGVYKNNGLSEIFYFDYVENCNIPTLLMAKNQGRSKVEVSWVLGGTPTGLYMVQYRKKGALDWSSQQSYQPRYIITGLEDNTEYEYRIGSACGTSSNFGNVPSTNSGLGNGYTFSSIQQFTTDSKDVANANIQCGVLPSIDISNKSPLQTALGVNEVFTAGDFPVTVISANGANGVFSGTGFIQIPYLADTRVKVVFNNIQLNTDKKLISGVVETTYDPNESAVMFVSDGIGETFGDRNLKELKVNYPIQEIIYSSTPPPGKITVVGQELDKNGKPKTDGKGSKIDYPVGTDYQITDSTGKVWTVDEKGGTTVANVAKEGVSTSTNTKGITGTGSNVSVASISSKAIKLEWKENPNGQFAFDSPSISKIPASNYPSVKDEDGKSVPTPYKAVVNKQTELFDAIVTISDPSLKDAKISFKTLKTGKEISAREVSKTNTKRHYELSLVGAFDYAEEEVIAVLQPLESMPDSKQEVLGSFILVHMEAKNVNLNLVPLDNNSKNRLNALEESIKKEYKKVGVEVKIIKEDVLNISQIVTGNTIPSADPIKMDSYTPQQEAINNFYQKERDKNFENRYVLFVTDKRASNGEAGYMRLNGQFGYVYGGASVKTGAHEIGHGIFKLEHPNKTLRTPEKSTNLLMDYSDGTILSHKDWKQIGDPAFKMYGFQKKGDGEQTEQSSSLSEIENLIRQNDGSLVFASHNNQIKEFTAPNMTETVVTDCPPYGNNFTVYNPDGLPIITKNVGKYTFMNGTLYSITYKNKTYRSSQTIILNEKTKLVEKVTASPDYINWDQVKADGIKPTKTKDANGNEHDVYPDLSQYTLSVEFGGGVVRKCASKMRIYIDNCKYISIVQKDCESIDTDENALLNAVSDRIKFNTTNKYDRKNSRLFGEDKLLDVYNKLGNITEKTKVKTFIDITDDPNKSIVQNTNTGIRLQIVDDGKNQPEFKFTVNGVSKNNLDTFLPNLNLYFNSKESITSEDLVNAFEGLADLINELKIPEKYYNPERTDYNPILYSISILADPGTSLGLLITDTHLQMLKMNITNSNKVGSGHVYFAFKCGVWNGIVDQVSGLANSAAIVSDLLFGDGDKIAELWTGLKKLDIWCTETQGPENVCVWSLINKAHKGTTCQIAEQVGVDVANVLTIAISFAKVGQAAKVAQLMESLDTMNQVLKLTGKVIKPVVVGSGETAKIVFKVTKAFLQPGVKFTKLNGRLFSTLIPIPIDLTPNLEAAINKAKELLAKNKEAFDLEVQLKRDTNGAEIKDQNGNLIGVIEVDGQKIEILINPDESKLIESADEIVQGAKVVIAKALKNPEFKKVYDDLASGKTKRRFPNEFSLEEEAAIKFYTDETYYKFNQALIKQIKTEDILELEKLLNSTLDKLPSSPSNYYRGIGKDEIDILNNLKIGEVVPYKNFVSSSDNGIISARFIRRNITKTGSGALVIIESKNAKNIAKYSDAPEEFEFLHKSDSKFKLIEVLDNKILNSLEVTVDGMPPIYGQIFRIREL